MQMKITVPVILVTVLMCFRAGAQVTATGQVFAEVVEVISAIETSQLNFGRFAPGPQGGQIIMSPHGIVSTSGTIILSGGARNPATFQVNGEENETFSITLPDEPVILKHLSSSKTLNVENWISDPPAGKGTGFLQNGVQTVSLGATLSIGMIMENPPGLYMGSYEITFDYN